MVLITLEVLVQVVEVALLALLLVVQGRFVLVMELAKQVLHPQAVHLQVLLVQIT